MGKNLEIKVKTESHTKFIEKLNAKGITREKVLKQKDIYYEFPNGNLKLRIENGSYCLIKYSRDEINPERWSNYELLYLSGENPEKYLAGLFNEIAVVEKTRNLYIYKNTRIHLDEVKDLGKFLELETVVENITDEEAKKEFEEVVNFLGLDMNNQLKKSYKDILLEQKKAVSRVSC